MDAVEYQDLGVDAFALDGTSFALAMKNEKTELMLLSIISKSNAIIFARLSCAQKAQITELAKQRLKTCILAIGDGHNDSQMLAAADCGVRLKHTEFIIDDKKKRTENADFVITEFA